MACQSTTPWEAAPAERAAVICFASCVRLPSALVRKDQMEVSPLARGVDTPIRSITERRSLSPSSHTPTPIRSPYGWLSLAGDVWAYHVPGPYHRMGEVPPVRRWRYVYGKRRGKLLHPATCPFGSSLSASLACWFSRRLSAVHIC